MIECFGGFGKESMCWDCKLFELCAALFVLKNNDGRCPEFGWGYDRKEAICRLCEEFFSGKECKSKC